MPRFRGAWHHADSDRTVHSAGRALASAGAARLGLRPPIWSQNIAITTRLVDTVTAPMLLKTVQSKKIDPTRLITHRFKLGQILDAYDTFGRAADTHALKVIIAA